MREREKTFGRRGHSNGADTTGRPAPPPCAFGKRLRWIDTEIECEPARNVVEFSAVAKARLTAIYRDLVSTYSDPARSEREPVCSMSEGPRLCLLIGDHANVRLDEQRGGYILALNPGGANAITLETASDDVLFDHIICHLSRDRARSLSVTGHGLVSALVGQTLDAIERSLILVTLRQHHFNRTRAAEVLGISVRTIRTKLRGYRTEDGVDARENVVFRLRRSSPAI